MYRKNFTLLLAALMVSFYIGCSKKVIKPESVLDTPESHFSQGIRMLERGDLAGAEEEFNRAKGLNPQFPEAYAGLALIRVEQKKFDEAHKMAVKALDLNKKNRVALIVMGRVITAERKGDDWWKDAVKYYDKALDNYPNDSEALFYKGITYKEAYKFGDAASAFAKVIENKDDWSTKANAEWEVVQKIVRAAPGTKVGSKIALIKKIDRADIAVLFMEELKLAELLEKKRQKTYTPGFVPPDDPLKYQTQGEEESNLPTDIDTHWAKNWVVEIVQLGGMEMYPDHTFHPDELITRGEFALLIQNLLVLVLADPSLATKYYGEESHFPDVNSTHPAYNAIVLCVDRGILKANIDGSFGLTDYVSGADALLTIREMQNNLRMTF